MNYCFSIIDELFISIKIAEHMDIIIITINSNIILNSFQVYWAICLADY